MKLVLYIPPPPTLVVVTFIMTWMYFGVSLYVLHILLNQMDTFIFYSFSLLFLYYSTNFKTSHDFNTILHYFVYKLHVIHILMFTPKVWPTKHQNMLEYYSVFVNIFLNFSHGVICCWSYHRDVMYVFDEVLIVGL